MSDRGIIGVIILFMTISALAGLALGLKINESDQPSPIKTTEITVIDKDISDFTIYTSQGNILTTNKFQWKRLELNQTYVCESFMTGIFNCTQINGGK